MSKVTIQPLKDGSYMAFQDGYENKLISKAQLHDFIREKRNHPKEPCSCYFRCSPKPKQ